MYYGKALIKETLKKINSLIKEIQRAPFEGNAKPEGLKHNLAGVDLQHRLTYRIDNDAVIVSIPLLTPIRLQSL